MAQKLTNEEIQRMIQNRMLLDSDLKILVYLETFGIGKFPISKEKKVNYQMQVK